MADTLNLGLPLLAAEQAQKHVTHNQSLLILDDIVHLRVADRVRASPPVSPAEGDSYIIGAGATGAWVGRSNQIAVYRNSIWNFYVPAEGWSCWIMAEATNATFNGTAWVLAGEAPTVATIAGLVTGPMVTGAGTQASPFVIAGPIFGSATITIPSARREWRETVAALGVTPTSHVQVWLAPGVDTNENTPDFMSMSHFTAQPGTDEIEIIAIFASVESGPINLSWRSN